MAQQAVEQQSVSVRLACLAFNISQTCYRYQTKQSAENSEIADHLIRLTHNQRNWGFGLCFLYLRNVKGHRWNHKRVYRIYRELELNLRGTSPAGLVSRHGSSVPAVRERWGVSRNAGIVTYACC
jgi:putative transposase